MSLIIDTTNRIIIDGRSTGLSAKQRQESTVVYTPENRLTGQTYREHKMPHARYSTAHEAPATGVAGCAQFEADLRVLISTL